MVHMHHSYILCYGPHEPQLQILVCYGPYEPLNVYFSVFMVCLWLKYEIELCLPTVLKPRVPGQ